MWLLKPEAADFKDMPEVDYTGKLNSPVNYNNTFDEIVEGLKNPVVYDKMGEELIRELYIRAYNYTAMMFAGYNRLSYICMMYAEELKNRLLKMVFETI